MTERKASIDEIRDHPDNETDTEETQKKLKYPRSVFFIISNEFCERFSYYGMRTVLTQYLRQQLHYDDNTSTVIYHVFTMFVYFFPLFGAILADSLLGKFRTILYLSIIYALGQLLLSLSAIPPLGIPPREFSLVGLLLIAVGTGGIKPCVSAFGGDQFVLPQQERYLSTFFSLFYFSINSGSLISSFLTPILRSSVTCFGDNTCYSLAFLVPAILMAISIVIFILGRPLYRMSKPAGNVVFDVSKCISYAVSRKIRTKGEKREHWLDYADDKYNKSLIDDIKAALRVLVLFIPIPIFWALFDQQGSRWTIQATRMNGEIGNFEVQPDQMQVFNPFLVLAFIPLFEACVYPLMAKIGLQTSLRKLTIGGLFASLSFIASALVELQIETEMPVVPSQGLAQLRVFNTLNCNVNVTIEDSAELNFVVKNLDMWVKTDIKADKERTLKFTANFTECAKDGSFVAAPNSPGDGIVHGTFNLTEATATSYAITQQGLSYSYKDSVEKPTSGLPLVRALVYLDSTKSSVPLQFRKNGANMHTVDINSAFTETKLFEMKSDFYDIYLDDNMVKEGVRLQLGGIYTLLGSDIQGRKAVNLITVTEPNSLSILWLIPQYVVLTIGEVMFSVTGLEFAFSQAPSSMKSLLQAAWLLTVAFGNLIVAIVAEVSIFKRQFYEFLLFSGLMAIDMIIFAIMARSFKYVEQSDEQPNTEEIHMDGTINASYMHDEKCHL